MHLIDLRSYSEEILALLYEHIPDWRPTIDAERQRRAAAEACWNDPRAIRVQLKHETAYRWSYGYTSNEEARGVDEQESDRWEAMRARIRELIRQRRNRLSRQRRQRRRNLP